MNNKPIGVFDSGLGGLTAVRELRKQLPHEDIVYFGDTGRVPYGTRSAETIIAYTKQDIGFLLHKQVKYIVAACGTVSSTFPEEISGNLPVGYTGVVQAAARAAAKASSNRKIGIIGTEATIVSKSYEKALAHFAPGAITFSAACPLFVPLVENGHFQQGDKIALLAAEQYLAPIREQGVDTLILGCTHYPLLAKTISQVMGSSVSLVDPGRETALHVKAILTKEQLLSHRTEKGGAKYYVSDDAARFRQLASVFLGEYAGGEVQKIAIEEYSI